MAKYEQEAPFAVQIELVEGCQIRCNFCALTGIRGKDNNFKYMTEETLASVMEQMIVEDWNPRIEWAMHGEPSMHPDAAKLIAIAREIAPKYHFMMTSNGGGFLRKPGPLANITTLFEAGLNVLALDDYESVGIVPKIRDAIKGKIDGVDFYEYPEQPEGNPHRRRKPSQKVCTFIKDINVANKGVHATLNNHAGVGGPPLDTPMEARCAKPFREMSIRWDGNVAVCCNDFRGYYHCGNVVTDGLDKVWNGAAMYAARQMLIQGNRNFGPCAKCDAVSYRVGLLPDKFGKETLPKPNGKTKMAIAEALAGKPYTDPVWRDWEKVQ